MRRAATLLVVAMLLAACGSDRPEPVEDALQLDQNIPTDIDGTRVIAYNMDDRSGVLSVDGKRSEVSVGTAVDVGGATYEVVQIVADGDDEGPDGWISVREQ